MNGGLQRWLVSSNPCSNTYLTPLSFHDIADIKQSTGFDAELWLVDLCSFASAKAFADKFEKEVERLDILVANAAIISTKYEKTEDDWETSYVLFWLPFASYVLTITSW